MCAEDLGGDLIPEPANARIPFSEQPGRAAAVRLPPSFFRLIALLRLLAGDCRYQIVPFGHPRPPDPGDLLRVRHGHHSSTKGSAASQGKNCPIQQKILLFSDLELLGVPYGLPASLAQPSAGLLDA
jgi:hypothetical protein